MGLGVTDRPGLAQLGREWLLHGHLQDRVGMPLYLAETDREAMQQLAIDEWMAASPIYARRMQQALGFVGSDVPTIFKGLQLDIGAPHQFMDFKFKVNGSDEGEFWLAHCGALMDVEPLGEDFVVGMCHHIEDPTFDATAWATNPHAQVRPIHRPPRVPSDRHPHCHWTVRIDPDAPAAQPHPNLARMQSSPIAQVPVASAVGQASEAGEDGGGWPDYSGPFAADFILEDLSAAALRAALGELALQSHLLFRSYLIAAAERLGPETARRLGYRVLVGQAGLTALRLVRSIAAADPVAPAAAVAGLLGLHPLFHPRPYVDLRVEMVADTEVRLGLGPSPATDPGDPYSWIACMDVGGPAPLEAISQAAIPNARCRAEPAAPRAGERRAFAITIDRHSPPGREPPEVSLARVSTGADFRFRLGRPK